MKLLDPFNKWSIIHGSGCMFLTLILSYHVGINKWIAAGLVLLVAVLWELIADDVLRWNDPRGGDYYDILWDLAGCLAAVLML